MPSPPALPFPCGLSARTQEPRPAAEPVQELGSQLQGCLGWGSYITGGKKARPWVFGSLLQDGNYPVALDTWGERCGGGGRGVMNWRREEKNKKYVFLRLGMLCEKPVCNPPAHTTPRIGKATRGPFSPLLCPLVSRRANRAPPSWERGLRLRKVVPSRRRPQGDAGFHYRGGWPSEIRAAGLPRREPSPSPPLLYAPRGSP